MATPSIPARRRRRLAAVTTIAGACVVAACSKGERPATDTAAASATSGANAAAPSSDAAATGRADLERLQDYKLTMAKMDQWYGAMRNVALATKAHPELKDRFASDGNESIDEETARIEAIPEFKKAINDAGMSVREFEMVMWTSLQAGMAQGAIDAGANRDSIMKNVKVNPDNLAFMKEHAAELRAKQQQMQKEIPEN